jgi:uncharacterized protein YegL
LAAAPVITLPIVRLIQETFLKDSLQVNVAEVFLGGLLKPFSEIKVETNPDLVEYGFMDGVRELLLDSVPSDYVLNVVDEVSKYVANKLGLSVADFAAILKHEQSVTSGDMAEEIGYFATVTAQVLRRLGGQYAKFAEELDSPIKEPLNFLWQQGNTKIYSLCTDQPWTVPFDALVISSNYRINFAGSLAENFCNFLGASNFAKLYSSVNQAKDYNKISRITPISPLLVPLPSDIANQLFPLNADRIEPFIILATVESPEPRVLNTWKAADSIINITTKQGVKRLIITLLGTGKNGLPITKVSIAMLSAITQSLNDSSSNSIQEIIFVDKSQKTIEILNKVAHSLLPQKDPDEVQLLSAEGIDYTELRYLLAEGKWKDADEETAKVMLQASGQEERGWLDKEDMEKIPSVDLQTIDQLWVKHSNGHFGFSVQKRIWLSVGDRPENDDEIYQKFAESVGWYIKYQDKWRLWDEHIFTLNAPQGHLPRYLPSQQKRIRPYLFDRNDLVTLEKYKESLSNPEPCIPVVLIIDTSASMSGEPINALNQGLIQFQQELNKDNLVSMRIEVAVITFNSSVNIVQDFVTVNQFKSPRLSASGATETGKAIEVALNLIEDRQVVYKNSSIQYYRPWLLLITDGMPTDNWRNSAKRVRRLAANKKINFFAVGVDGVDISILSEIAPIDMPPLMLRELAFTQLFKWLSASVSAVSRSQFDDRISLPPAAWAMNNEVLHKDSSIKNTQQLRVEVNKKTSQIQHDVIPSNSIVIIGDRAAGKTTFLAALAYSSSIQDYNTHFQVLPCNEKSKLLLEDSEYVLMQGLQLPRNRIDRVGNLPVYQFEMVLKPSLFVQPISAIQRKNININIYCREYPGELFYELKKQSIERYKGYISEYIDDLTAGSKLLFLIDGNTRDDRGYREALMTLSSEIRNRLTDLNHLKQYRIGVVISKCEDPLLWTYRHNVSKLMSLKFPETQNFFEQWKKYWGCEIEYFACSSFGVIGNPPRPNFRVIDREESGIYGVIENPIFWKPFGLLAPIYWLCTGKIDPRLQR